MRENNKPLVSIKNTLIGWFSIQIVRVRGKSMEPAIGENSWKLASRAGFRKRDPQRFDVVRLEDPRAPNHWIIKRIIGLPGEEIVLKTGELVVDGTSVEDLFACCPDPALDNGEWWPRDDEYIVLGDNRSASTDSRVFGPVKRTAIRSRVLGKGMSLDTSRS
ncbi:MAG: signal peptidase I [Dehalococcoidia bacterium]|jgi:signal peptidase I|nr:signal peptidase I [Dehalococcoidia bacterium]